ncbi:MAG: LCP family protein [Candidatus Acetothermia bacterium]|nr:LCP family protein [Candidatus Acetothermia bacterium]MDH7505157.1 LCP family protein [Candidatus Acetothermia bacterium]
MNRRARLLLLGLGIVAIVVLLIILRPGGSSIDQAEATILVLGLDSVAGQSRSDTMILAHIKGQEVALISIPRDLRLQFPDGQFHKANAAYSLGQVGLAKRVISDFLEIPIPFYVLVDYQGFREIVDLLGGVTIQVEKHLKYDDQAQDLHIDIPAGEQLLDGKKALDYIRYRDETGDIGRIKRQQQFIKALLAKGYQDQSELNSLVRALTSRVTTNLALVDLFNLAKQLRGLEAEKVKLVQLPGDPVRIGDVDYLQPKIVETRNLVARLVRGLDVLIPSEVRLGVLNGSGALALARNTTTFLEQHDFQVVFYGNADNFSYKHTFLINLSGDARKADLVKAVLPGEVRVVSAEEFTALGEGSLGKLAQMGYNLAKVDLLFIGGPGFKVGP